MTDTAARRANWPLIYVAAAAVTNWAQVQAVEVCLVLYGSESIDVPNDIIAGTNPPRKFSEYIDCDGSLVNINNLTGPDAKRAKRMHLAFRNVFQLRSQGLIGTAM